MNDMRSHMLRRRSGRAIGPSMSAQEFVGHLRGLLRIGDRQIRIGVTPSWGPGKEDQVLLDYINLPHGIGAAGGGAEGENNRWMCYVRGFGAAGAPPTSGKVSADVIKSHIYKGELARKNRVTMRGKTGTPQQVAKHIADYLNKVAADVPPRFTHTGTLKV